MMADEKLEVMVVEKPGLYSIKNFEALKTKIEEYTSQYTGATFDCEDKDSRQMAKAICTELRSTKNTIETKRKAVKASCMEPYNDFADKCKELTGMIDKTTDGIDSQLKTYEEGRKKAKLEKIRDMFDSGISDDLKPHLKFEQVMKPEWLNATASMKSIEESMSFSVSVAKEELKTINTMPEDVRAGALAVWDDCHEMVKVTEFVSNFQKQKEAILEQQHQKEIEQARRDAVVQMRQEEARKAEIDELKKKAEHDEGFMQIPDFDDDEQSPMRSVWFRVTGTEDDIKSVRTALDSFGIPYEEKEAM